MGLATDVRVSVKHYPPSVRWNTAVADGNVDSVAWGHALTLCTHTHTHTQHTHVHTHTAH